VRKGVLDQPRVGDTARVCERRVLGRHICGSVCGCYAVAGLVLERGPGTGGNSSGSRYRRCERLRCRRWKGSSICDVVAQSLYCSCVEMGVWSSRAALCMQSAGGWMAGIGVGFDSQCRVPDRSKEPTYVGTHCVAASRAGPTSAKVAGRHVTRLSLGSCHYSAARSLQRLKPQAPLSAFNNCQWEL
jgi:hypothetical protein